MRSRTLALASLLLALAGPVAGQADIPPDIRAKMNGWVGTWEFQEQTFDAPGATPTSATGTWTARWIYPHLIEWSGTFVVDGEDIGFVQLEGYDPMDQGFAQWYDSSGLRGWSWDGEWDGTTHVMEVVNVTPEGQRLRERCRWPYSDDFSVMEGYSCERLTDGRWWTFRSGSARKVGGG